MNRTQTKGIVLRRREYGEADRIVTVLTNQLGKVGAIAKGTRRLKSKLAGGIELFIESDFTLLRGRSALLTVTSVKPKRVFEHVASNYERMQIGARYLQWFNALIEEEEGQELFDVLEGALVNLNQPAIDSLITTAWLQMQLLTRLGHEPNISSSSTGQRLDEEESYVFIIEDGTFEPGSTGTQFTANDIKTWRLLITMEPEHLQRVRGVATSLRNTHHVLDQFFSFHMNL